MFKTCPHCEKTWNALSELLADPSVRYHGYQASLKDPMLGLFLFSHMLDSCLTTFAVKVSAFADMLPRNPGTIPMKTDPNCKGLCLDVTNVEHCDVIDCVGNRIRRLIKQIVEYPKGISGQ